MFILLDKRLNRFHRWLGGINIIIILTNVVFNIHDKIFHIYGYFMPVFALWLCYDMLKDERHDLDKETNINNETENDDGCST
jgi:hypothetical protein